MRDLPVLVVMVSDAEFWSSCYGQTLLLHLGAVSLVKTDILNCKHCFERFWNFCKQSHSYLLCFMQFNPFFFPLSVGGLLQSKFASVSLLPSASLQDSRGPRTSSFGKAPPPAPWSVFSPLASVFTIPAAAPEPQMKTVGTRRQQGLVPLEKSITYGKGKLLIDMALFMGRSFRVGWGPSWTLINCGDQVSEAKHLRNTSMEYGFLPAPVAPKSWVVALYQVFPCRQVKVKTYVLTCFKENLVK